MGRRKITIKTLPTASGRKATFTMRVKGVAKKAQELSKLCDVPHLLIAFSTSGKPILSMANSTFEETLTAYSNLNPQKRLEAKEGCLKRLNKYGTEGLAVDVPQSANHSSQLNKLHEIVFYRKKKAHVEKVQEEISKIENVLGPLSSIDDLDQIDSLDKLTEIENCLLHLLQQNELRRRINIIWIKALFEQMEASGVNIQQPQ